MEVDIAQAQARVAAVAQAAARLRARIEAMDAALEGLAETLRTGATRLAQELSALEGEIAALDAAGGGDEVEAAPAEADRPPRQTAPAAPVGDLDGARLTAPAPAGDIDGARLIALNMALNGDSREATDRYLAEHFDLPERAQLIAEVYAAVEG